jgi:MFS family permease
LVTTPVGTGLPLTRFLLLAVLGGLAIGMTAPITALYVQSFGAGPASVGLVWASVAVGLLLVDGLGTRVVPRLDGRSAMVLALCLFGIGVAISGLAPGLLVMAAGRVLQGAGVALCYGGAQQVVLRHSPPDGMGRALGRFNAAWFAGVALGPLAGGGLSALADGQRGFRLAFGVCAGLCAATAVAVRFGLPPLPSGREPEVGLPHRPRARPGLRMWPALALGLFGEGMRGGLEFTVVPLVGADHFGLSAAQVSLGMSALALLDIITMHFGGRLADRLGRRPILVVALGVGFVGCVLLPVFGGLGGFMVWCALLGVPVGATWVVPAMLAVDVSAERDAGLASFRIAADLGEVVGPTGAGALLAGVGPIGAVAGIGGLAAVMGLWVRRLPEADQATSLVSDDLALFRPEAA